VLGRETKRVITWIFYLTPQYLKLILTPCLPNGVAVHLPRPRSGRWSGATAGSIAY
jgi:hypothetical protein